MNKKLSFVTAAFLGISSLYAQTVNLQPGWNLIGTGGMKLDLQNTFASYSDIKYVWAFENQNKSWLVYGNTQNSKENISNSSYNSNQTNYLDTYSGLWVLNDSNYIKSVDLVEATNIPQDVNISSNQTYTLNNPIENGAIRGVESIDNYAYALDREGYLLIYDISKVETDKSPLKNIKLDLDTTHHLKIIDNYLYITGYDILVYDINERENPKFIKSIDQGAMWNEPSYSNNILLTNKSYDSNSIYLFDLTNRENPTYLKTFNLGKSIISNNIIYSINSNHELTINKFNTTTNDLELLNSINFPNSNTIYNLYYYENKLVVIQQDKTFIYDTTNMRIIKELEHSYNRSSGCYENICVIDSKIYNLNDLNNVTSLNLYIPTSDGFPFQVDINEQNYIVFGSQDYVKISGLNKNIISSNTENKNIDLPEIGTNIPQEEDLSLTVSGSNGTIDTQEYVMSNIYIPTGLNKPVTLTYYRDGVKDTDYTVYDTDDTYAVSLSPFTSAGNHTLKVEISDGTVTYTDSVTFYVEEYTYEPTPSYNYELNYDFITLDLNDIANKSFYSNHYHLIDSINFDSTGYAKVDYSNYTQYSDKYKFDQGVLKYTEHYNSSDSNTTNMHEVTLKALAKNENGIVLIQKPKAEPNYYDYESYTTALISASATKDTFNPTLPYTLYKSWGGYVKINSDNSLEFDYEDNNKDSTYSNGVISSTYNYSSYEDETFDENGSNHYGYKEEGTLTFMYKIGEFWLAEVKMDGESWDASVYHEDQKIDFTTYNTWNKFFTATNNTLWSMKFENGKIYTTTFNDETGMYDKYVEDTGSSYTITNNTVLDMCYEEGTYCQKYEIKDGKMYTFYSGTYMEILSEKPVFNYIETTNSGY